jgi:predicted secreted Zn-dependent protease
MKTATLLRLAAACSFLLPGAAPSLAAEWQAKEAVKPYAISGTTGSELYESIGAKGPLIGGSTRTIAHTTYDLKWSRKYVPQGDSCRLVSAKPFLTITYTLPKPSAKLTGAAARHWKTFIDGISAHEKVHGQYVREMVDALIETTVGLTVPGDPGCRKIKEEIKPLILAAGQAYQQKSREFDRVEMSKGANVHSLILALVNGR